jgi:hypothetical protein
MPITRNQAGFRVTKNAAHCLFRSKTKKRNMYPKAAVDVSMLVMLKFQIP